MKQLKNYIEYIKEEVSKEEEIGSVSTDTASIIVTGDIRQLNDENKKSVEDDGYKSKQYDFGVVGPSTGADGSYNVIARWIDFDPDNIAHNVPNEIVIKIRDEDSADESSDKT